MRTGRDLLDEFPSVRFGPPDGTNVGFVERDPELRCFRHPRGQRRVDSRFNDAGFDLAGDSGGFEECQDSVGVPGRDSSRERRFGDKELLEGRRDSGTEFRLGAVRGGEQRIKLGFG